uniref:SRCR domain-containing protein n=1 Tax=Amphimedon queenslandica TaxID=400682 RepID=A0A1X7U349_AMPQE
MKPRFFLPRFLLIATFLLTRIRHGLACTSGSIRLVGGTSTSEGRVEVCSSAGAWGTVCDDYWDNTDASVACRQLGYASGTAFSNAYFGQGTGSIVMDDVRCTGTESTLINCSHVTYHNCYHYEDAGVRCTAVIAATNGALILSRYNITSNSYYYGTVRVYYNGWGNICYDYYYNSVEANVICHQLGYTGASSYSRTGLVSYGTDYLSMKWDEVNCASSSYLSIAQCSYSTYISGYSCSYSNSYDATVYCYSTRIWNSNPYSGMIRLQGGAYSNEGRVEVYCNGRWGTICDDGFSSTDARTVCKQLGYSYYSRYDHLSLPGSSSQPIWSTHFSSSSSSTCFNSRNSCPSSSYYIVFTF